MDEPTSALDPMSTARVEELIRELGRLYVAIVTHNMQQAARVSDYTAFFLLGIFWNTTGQRRSSITVRQKDRRLHLASSG